MFNKDGKLFGKISIIDIGAVVLAVLLICGVYVKFFGGRNNRAAATAENFRCIVEVKNVRTYTVDALAKGGEVYDSTTKEYIGDITGVTSAPGENTVAMADGSYRIAPMENRYNAYVTIEFSGKDSANGYYTQTNKQLGVGSTLQMNAKFAKCEGTITQIEKIQ